MAPVEAAAALDDDFLLLRCAVPDPKVVEEEGVGHLARSCFSADSGYHARQRVAPVSALAGRQVEAADVGDSRTDLSLEIGKDVGLWDPDRNPKRHLEGWWRRLEGGETTALEASCSLGSPEGVEKARSIPNVKAKAGRRGSDSLEGGGERGRRTQEAKGSAVSGKLAVEVLEDVGGDLPAPRGVTEELSAFLVDLAHCHLRRSSSGRDGDWGRSHEGS